MPFEIMVDAAARVLRVRYSGEVGTEERLVFARQVLEKAQATGITHWLLDFRRAQSRGADPAGVRNMANELTPRFPPGVRMAYLLTYDHQLDDSLERLVRAQGVHVERFRDPGAAIAWLQAEDGDVADAVEPTPLNRAFRLAAAAIDPAVRVTPDQFAAIGELVHELLEKGIDETTITRLAGRMSAAMDTRHRQ